MAIIIGKKLVNDLPENDRVAIGITLPIQRGGTGYFAQSFQTVDQVKSNIANLLQTRMGERLMQPNFGTTLHSILFDQTTDELEGRIQSSIETAIRNWMPYVNIQNIDVSQTSNNKDFNTFTVSVSFIVPGQQNLQTVTFNITQ